MVNVSCITITIIVILSLLNLLLLLHMIIKSLQKYDNNTAETTKQTRQQINHNNHETEDYSKTSIAKYRFMTAVIRMEANQIDFICSSAIISSSWVLTSAHCIHHQITMNSIPLTQLRIAGNSSRWAYGIWHDLDRIISHDQFEMRRGRHLNNIGLISVKQAFKGANERPATLPSASFKYVANTSAVSLGWTGSQSVSSRLVDGGDVEQQQLYAVNIALFWYKLCELQYPDERVVDNGMVCAGRYPNERSFCVVDAGGLLVQNGMLIGVVSYNAECLLASSYYKPVIYTKIANFQSWIRYMEKVEKVAAKAVFKAKP